MGLTRHAVAGVIATAAPLSVAATAGAVTAAPAKPCQSVAACSTGAKTAGPSIGSRSATKPATARPDTYGPFTNYVTEPGVYIMNYP